MSDPLIKILLVEDNLLDAKSTIKAAERLKLANAITHVSDGQKALELLTTADADDRPDLVLLDLNLPGIDGLEILEKMKSDENLRRIPVVILTTSVADGDVLGAYDRGANAYIHKPVDLNGWVEVVNQIDSFWFSVVQRPPR